MDIFKSNSPASGQVAPKQSGGKVIVDPIAMISELNKGIASLERKNRVNEERILTERKRMQMIEHNILVNHKRFLSEIKIVNDEISDIKRMLDDFKTKMMVMARDIENAARKEDVAVLEKYINMWEPVSFVTRKEVDKIIDEKLLDLGIEKPEENIDLKLGKF